ncbi:hypothetical protein [Chryseobacterium oryctis]|uniref:Uncharacterized protein n=1 Tax=Chryseobacterium oryctis TaxID=2952618 RepID=A0ABT3HPG9_9FLAO|nr:hypothetical protein [Chryseobacterium oryctis]MCW3161648.1 hypothetical protein [Chryseobacterium oryctis]
MKNYKKLLFAGLAIVPLALSSWTSEGNSLNYGNGEMNQVSSIQIIGDTAASSVVTSKTKKNVFDKSTVDQTNVVETKVATTLEPVLTFGKVLENYK